LVKLASKIEVFETGAQVVLKKIPGMKKDTNIDLQPFVKEETGEYNCPMTKVLRIIGGKWKLLILNAILLECPKRFGALKKKMPDITQATLTTQLRELERDGIILRTVYAESPPRVEYKLTELGLTLVPIIELLNEWGNTYCIHNKEGVL
jgi:DNA-binding HxlR family transcriptional regulator